MNSIQEPTTVSFWDLDDIYVADSCEPLKAAAAAGEVQLEALARGHYPGYLLPDDTVDGVRTLGFWDAAKDQDWGLEWHRNEGIELTYVAKGNIDFSVDDQIWQLNAGHLTVTRPWQRHRVGAPNVRASNLHWLIIDVGVRRPNQAWHWPEWVALAPQDLARLTTLLQQNEQAAWIASPALRDSFVAATAQVSEHGGWLESDLRIRISSLLLELLRMLESADIDLDVSLTAPQRGVRLFLEELEEHLDQRWTLQRMAVSCSMGRTQFTKHCQELTNLSPIEFLTHARLQHAKRLLETSACSITDIAAQCGFETPQYFATRFRKFIGISPAAYRAARAGTPDSDPSIPRDGDGQPGARA